MPAPTLEPGGPYLPRELVSTLGALKLPHAPVPADMDAELLNGCKGGKSSSQ